MRKIALVLCLSALAPGAAVAQVSGVTPVKTLPGYSVQVSAPAATPLPVTCTNCGSGTTSGGSVTPVVGVDGGYPVTVDQGAPGAAAWKVDASATTQPVSVVSLPMPSGASSSLNQTTIGNQTTKLNDGSHTVSVSASNALKVDGSAATQPVSAATLPLPTGAAQDRTTAAAPNACQLSDGAAFYKGTTPSDTQPVSGTFWQATQPVSGTFFQATQPVSGTFFQATQPVSIAATVNTSDAHTTAGGPLSCRLTDGAAFYAGPTTAQLPTALDGSGFLKTHEQGTAAVSAASLPLPSGASTAIKQPALGVAGTASADVITVQGITSMTALKVDGSGVTQPVSGTVTANVGTTNGIALDATLTGGTQTTRVTDGTNTATVKAASTAAGAADKALVVAVSPNNSVAVTGTFFQATQPVSGTVTATQATGSNLHVQVDTAPTTTVTGTVAATQSGTWTVQPGNTANTTAWKVDGSAVTQPVSGTVTANAGTNLNTSALALDSTVAKDATVAKLTLGQASTTAAQTGPLVQGAVTTAAPSYTNAQTDPLSLTTAGALRVDASATTQPVSGTVAATQSGTWTVQPGNTANTTAWKVDGSAVTQPISGTVTANAGTNLNTSALALDATLTGGTATTRITDGTNTATVKAASTAAAATDKSLVVALSPNSPIPAGSAVIGHVISDASSAVIGHVITDTNSTTAVTGNVTVVQPTGTNLHAVLDTTSTTAVTQATGTNLHAVLDTTSTTAVTQATGTNLHAVLDTTSTTACTQATGTNLHVVTDATSVLAANQSVNAAQIGGTNTVSGGANGTLGVGGTQANNAAITANPMLVGSEALVSTAAPGTVATSGNIRRLVSDTYGDQWVRDGSPNQFGVNTAALSTALTQQVAAPAASTFIYVTDITVQSTTATGSTLQLKWGTGSNCGTGTVVGPIYVSPANTANATTITATHYIIRIPAATALCAVCGSATNTCLTSINGYIAQ